MESSESKSSAANAASGNGDARLVARIEELEHELEALRAQPGGARPGHRKPARRTLLLLATLVAIGLAVAFVLGYWPRQRVYSQVVSEQKENQESALPVRVAQVKRGQTESTLRLPGTVQAIAETPVLARADGYVKRRLVDIGDRVHTGQLLAEIEAPELDDQANQAAAALGQARASLEQARASYRQGQSNAELARVTATRWSHLKDRGVVSRQENDQQQANFQAQTAGLAALSKAVDAASSNVTAVEASLARVEKLRAYLQVRAPFAGIVTLRNIDVGTLVTAGNTLLYRVAETATLRTFLNVPQAYAEAMQAGLEADLILPDHPGVKYPGRVVRTAGSLDPATRTMLVEVHAANRDGALLPGMYVEVRLAARRTSPPLLVDADSIETRSDGTYVFSVGADRTVRSHKVQVGRDYGAEVEILGGATEGEMVIVNPNDAVREGIRVKPVPQETPAAGGARSSGVREAH